jgi:predicted enzyme related to lactoylglutathione lyase
MKNPIRWFEIYVEDMKRAKAFYEEVFAVKFTRIESPEIEMWGFPSNPDAWGCSGSLVKMPGLKPSGISTVVYFASEDCSVEEKRVLRNGGRIHKSKMSIGQYGFITLAYDSEGNMIGIHSMK